MQPETSIAKDLILSIFGRMIAENIDTIISGSDTQSSGVYKNLMRRHTITKRKAMFISITEDEFNYIHFAVNEYLEFNNEDNENFVKTNFDSFQGKYWCAVHTQQRREAIKIALKKCKNNIGGLKMTDKKYYWFLLSFFITDSSRFGYFTYHSKSISISNKDMMRIRNQIRAEAKISARPTILSISYLGFMTQMEFNNL